jgi:hypothetical protein
MKVNRLEAENERLRSKIGRAVEIYGQEFGSPHERSRRMWLALHDNRAERAGG